MYEDDYDFVPETDATQNELTELLKKIPKNTVTILNLPRHKQAIASIDKIVRFVKVDCPDAEVTVEFDEFTGTCLCLRIIAEELNIYKIGEFCEATKPANTMDVIPRLDEKLEIGFTYRQVKLPAPLFRNNYVRTM